MSDQELDNLFKEAAEGFKVPSDQSAWQDMASRLDQAGTAAPSFWNWKTVSTSVIVGGVLLSSIWFSTTSDIPASQEKIAKVKSDVSTVVKNRTEDSETLAKSNDKSENGIGKEEKSNSDQLKGNGQESKVNDVLRDENESDKSSARSSYSGKSQDDMVKKNNAVSLKNTDSQKNLRQEIAKEDASMSEKNAFAREQRKHESSGLKSVLDDGSLLAQTDVKKKNEDQSIDSSHEVKDNLLTPGDSSVYEQKEVLLDSADSDSEQEQKEEKRKNKGAISLKVAVAPDFSSVKYFDGGKPGINYGILVGYVFNNRWSVYSGVISSRKIYSSTRINESYTNSGGYDYPIKKLDGDCRILDIPLNVYYTFFPERSFSLKTGIGFSSYVMLKEDYVYYVDNPYGSDVYDQNIRNKNNDFFKVLNVSVILQKKISNKLSIEFEPFLKAPLAGVGEGEVSLVSLGAFFNVMYNIPLQKK